MRLLNPIVQLYCNDCFRIRYIFLNQARLEE